MSEFKPGDRVRWVSEEHYDVPESELAVFRGAGTIVIATQEYHDEILIASDPEGEFSDVGHWACLPHHIILVEPAAAPNERPATSTFVKHDTGKNDMALWPPRAFAAVGRVLTFGAKKYDASNWVKCTDYRRYASAALRHFFAYLRGERIDSETGESHLAHLMTCIAFLLEFEEMGIDTNTFPAELKETA